MKSTLLALERRLILEAFLPHQYFYARSEIERLQLHWLALTINDSKMVTKELLDLTDLTGAPTLRIHDPSGVVVVS